MLLLSRAEEYQRSNGKESGQGSGNEGISKKAEDGSPTDKEAPSDKGYECCYEDITRWQGHRPKKENRLRCRCMVVVGMLNV